LERRAELKVITFAGKSALITAALYFCNEICAYFYDSSFNFFLTTRDLLLCICSNKILGCSSYIWQLTTTNKSPPLQHNVGHDKYFVEHMFEKNVFDLKITRSLANE